MKQRPRAELQAALERYRALVRRYHDTLDLMSDAGLRELDRWIAEAEAHAELVAALSPAPLRLLDVGSGVGLPGVVIAAALPDLQVELVERRRRRAAFLEMAVAGAGTANAVVRRGDVADLEGEPVQVVSAQAVGPWRDVYRLTAHRHDAAVVLVGRSGPEAESRLRELDEFVGGASAIAGSRPLGHRGTLLAVRCPGGRACPSSG